VTPVDPLSGTWRPPPAPTPARLHAVRRAQASLLLGPRSRKPFPQIKIYHYTPASRFVVHIVIGSGAYWAVRVAVSPLFWVTYTFSSYILPL